jgi:carboxypeptidase family protein
VRLWVIAICCLSGVLGAAQSPPAGKLSGLVVDTSDNVMPGVSVGLRGPESRSTVTDKDGRFAFASLTAGEYELWARLTGFATTVEKVAVSEKTEPVKIRMRVGREAPEIVFIGDPPNRAAR